MRETHYDESDLSEKLFKLKKKDISSHKLGRPQVARKNDNGWDPMYDMVAEIASLYSGLFDWLHKELNSCTSVPIRAAQMTSA